MIDTRAGLPIPRHYLRVGVLFFIILIAGTTITLYSAQQEQAGLRADLLTKARLGYVAVSSEDISSLTGTAADLGTPEYQQIKSQLVRIRASDPDIRSVYLIGKSPQNTYFMYADSEDPSSAYYSPPGEEYPAITGTMLNVLLTGTAQSGGLTEDRRGTRVSGYVPVTDPGTNLIIGLFGMEIDAKNWNWMIVRAVLLPMAATFIMLVMLLVFFIIQQRTDEERQRLELSERAVVEANRQLNMLSSITRHDILNQITALGMVLQILVENVTDEQMLSFIRKAQDTNARITHQIEFTRQYQDIGIRKPGWQNIESLVAQAKNQLKDCPFDVVIETGTLEVYADPNLARVVYHLLENAARHGKTVTTVRFFTRSSGSDLILTCEDDGIGIDPVLKKNLFRRSFGKHATLGSYMMREILAITGITIDETGEPGKGARFEMTIPRGYYRQGPAHAA